MQVVAIPWIVCSLDAVSNISPSFHQHGGLLFINLLSELLDATLLLYILLICNPCSQMTHYYAQEKTYLCKSHLITFVGCLLIYHKKKDQHQYKRKAQAYMSGGKVNFFGFKVGMYLTAHQGMSNLSRIQHCW